MKSSLAISLLVVAAGLMGCHSLHHCEECKETGVFVHITHGPEDPHRALMALQMAALMADADKDVLVYCDINAIELVLKGSPDVKYKSFPTSHTLLKELLEKGAKVTVCPGCLEVAGRSDEEVMEGIQVASKEAFFGFTKGRVLTLDY